MKTRNGFVSNSSSSSFVILGIKTEHLDVDKAEELELYYDYDENSGCYVVGEKLGRWSEGDAGELKETSVTEIQLKTQELLTRLGKLDLDKPREVKLYYGEMMS